MFCERFKHLPLRGARRLVPHDAVTLADIGHIDRLDYKAERMNPQLERAKADPEGFYLCTLQHCALWSDRR